ncbi:MAG: hypothetical protein WKF84_19495 [Pyrinomonadaceae bacterium]
MTVVTQILNQIPGLAKPQRKFLPLLLATMLAARGRLNFRNLARYSPYSERTHSQAVSASFDFPCSISNAIAKVTDASDHSARGARRYLYPQKWQAHLRARQVLERLCASQRDVDWKCRPSPSSMSRVRRPTL